MVFVVPFLISVGTVCAITSFLAVLMVIADVTIANYGDVTITINNDKQLTVEGGGTLLSTLKQEQVFIPSACGGRGSCGLCKLKVLDGAGDPLPTETPWLTAEERKEKIRLSCQIKVKQNLAIEVPEDLFNVKQYRSRVSALRDLTHDIKEVRLKLIDPPEMDYVAGHFIQFEVPEYEMTDAAVYRAYSMSSEPSSRDEIELEIRYVPQGICTTYVHQHLKEGDEVIINGPYGDFRLSEIDKPMICIAGGSGMAPIKSILMDMKRKGINRKVLYFFGAKAKRDIFLVDEMRTLENELPDFRFIPALSEPDPEDNWDGETGLITEVVDRHVDDAGGMEGYLCGSPLMIDACVEVLGKKGMPETSIFYDKFA